MEIASQKPCICIVAGFFRTPLLLGCQVFWGRDVLMSFDLVFVVHLKILPGQLVCKLFLSFPYYINSHSITITHQIILLNTAQMFTNQIWLPTYLCTITPTVAMFLFISCSMLVTLFIFKSIQTVFCIQCQLMVP